VLGELDRGRRPGGQVPDQALGGQVGQDGEEPVALAAITAVPVPFPPGPAA
jgi:hypothetical protein